jgi:hypothetical protein
VLRIASANAVRMMREGPSEPVYRHGLQTASKLLGLNAPVVSVRGKGPLKGQVSNKKTNVNELPQRRRKD